MKKNVHQQDLMGDEGEWRVGRVVVTIILLLLIIAASIYLLVIKPDTEQEKSQLNPPVATKKSRVTEVVNPVTQRKEIIFEDEVKEILSPEEVYSYNKPRDMAKVVGEKINKQPLSSTNKAEVIQETSSITELKNQVNPVTPTKELKDSHISNLEAEESLPLNSSQKETITEAIKKLPPTESGSNQVIEIVEPINLDITVISELKTPPLEVNPVQTINNPISTVSDTKEVITSDTPAISNLETLPKADIAVENNIINIPLTESIPTKTQEKPAFTVTNPIPTETTLPVTSPTVEIAQQADSPSALINKAKPVSHGRVVSALITTGLIDREPIDKVTKAIAISQTEEINLYFFTKIMRMIGQTLYHQWIWRDQVMYEKPINVKARRWRATTSKLISYSTLGKWVVRILDSERNILKEVKFTIIKK